MIIMCLYNCILHIIISITIVNVIIYNYFIRVVLRGRLGHRNLLLSPPGRRAVEPRKDVRVLSLWYLTIATVVLSLEILLRKPKNDNVVLFYHQLRREIRREFVM